MGGASGGTGLPDGFHAIIEKYDTNGVLQWTETSTGPNGALPFGGPLVDAGGNCYVAGWFQTSTVFGTNALTGLGYWDFFLAKVRFSPLALGIGRSNALPQLSVYGDLGIRFALEGIDEITFHKVLRDLMKDPAFARPLQIQAQPPRPQQRPPSSQNDDSRSSSSHSFWGRTFELSDWVLPVRFTDLFGNFAD